MEDKREYWKERYEDLERNYKQVNNELETTKFYSYWFIAFMVILILALVISIAGAGDVINQGYTLEQVTNATIQTCKALSNK